jgi:geranylgeranyl pyrophosphate synthase
MRYVGISFQITDDILNITDDLGKQQKAEDFHERKFTIVVHHLRNNK